MLNPFRDVNWQPNTQERRKFGLSLLIGFTAMAAVFMVAGRITSGEWPRWPLWLAGIGGTMGVFFWAVPAVARPFYLVWYFIACSIGFVVSNLLFAVFFYLVFTPIGLLLRAFGRLSIQKAPDKAQATYWQDAVPVSDPKRYYRQF